jgi:hypothetical protein
MAIEHGHFESKVNSLIPGKLAVVVLRQVKRLMRIGDVMSKIRGPGCRRAPISGAQRRHDLSVAFFDRPWHDARPAHFLRAPLLFQGAAIARDGVERRSGLDSDVDEVAWRLIR